MAKGCIGRDDTGNTLFAAGGGGSRTVRDDAEGQAGGQAAVSRSGDGWGGGPDRDMEFEIQ